MKIIVPTRLSWVDRVRFTREWLEEVIRSGIAPSIPNIVIHCVSCPDDSGKGAYIVEVPKSHTAHQARDLRYYKRHNFQSVAMPDSEIRHVMNRGIASIIEGKISGGLGLLYGFFVMVAHTAELGTAAVETIGPQHNALPDSRAVDAVANMFAQVFHERAIFNPTGGTLRDLPRDKGIIEVVVGRGVAKDVRELPGSFVLMEGVKQAVATCGTTLATYGPAMGLDLVVKVDRLYEHLCSAQQVFSAVLANREVLEESGGRVTEPVALEHIRLLVRYLAKFHRCGVSAHFGTEPD